MSLPDDLSRAQVNEIKREIGDLLATEVAAKRKAITSRERELERREKSAALRAEQLDAAQRKLFAAKERLAQREEDLAEQTARIRKAVDAELRKAAAAGGERKT